MLALGQQMGGMPAMGEGPELDLDRDVYMGHEFCAEVLEVGPDTVGAGARHARDVDPGAPHDDAACSRSCTATTWPAATASGCSSRRRCSLEVPNGLDFRHAALTEPMAVGLHAVNKSAITARRGRAGARVRAGGAGRDRRAEAQGRRHDRGHRLLTGAPGAGHHHGRHRGRRPGRGARVRRVDASGRRQAARVLRGHRRAGDHRLGAARRARTAPGSSWSACAWRPTASTRSSGSARS